MIFADPFAGGLLPLVLGQAANPPARSQTTAPCRWPLQREPPCCPCKRSMSKQCPLPRARSSWTMFSSVSDSLGIPCLESQYPRGARETDAPEEYAGGNDQERSLHRFSKHRFCLDHLYGDIRTASEPMQLPTEPRGAAAPLR